MPLSQACASQDSERRQGAAARARSLRCARLGQGTRRQGHQGHGAASRSRADLLLTYISARLDFMTARTFFAGAARDALPWKQHWGRGFRARHAASSRRGCHFSMRMPTAAPPPVPRTATAFPQARRLDPEECGEGGACEPRTGRRHHRQLAPRAQGAPNGGIAVYLWSRRGGPMTYHKGGHFSAQGAPDGRAG